MIPPSTPNEKEIHHKTEYIDKRLPTIFYKKEEMKNMTEGSNTIIEVSDVTSAAALKTFTKLKDSMQLK